MSTFTYKTLEMRKNLIIIFSTVIVFCCSPLHCKPMDSQIKGDIYDDISLIESEYHGHLDKKTIEYLRKCENDLETLELCMRCAKITKSTIVYPLCCGNEDKIKDWCHDYVFFRAQNFTQLLNKRHFSTDA